MEQINLIKEKNYSDEYTKDGQNRRLDVTAFNNHDDVQKVDIDELEICRYFNVETQTSFEYEPCDMKDCKGYYDEDGKEEEEEEEEEEQQQQGGEDDVVQRSNSADARGKSDMGTPLRLAKSARNDEERVSNFHQKDQHEKVLKETAAVSDDVDKGRQLNLLRKVLAVERQRNEKSRQNNVSMQQYLQQLQTEYLRLQSDLAEALELGHKIKAQKEAQLAAVTETVKEKDRLIENLKTNLESLDEAELKKEFDSLLAKQNRLAEMEKQQLKDQMDIVEQQLTRERAAHAQTIEQLQVKFDADLKSNKLELESTSKKLTDLQSELNKVLGEPQNLIIRELKEEKSQLLGQVEELNLNLNESQAKYELLRKRVDTLVRELALMERASQDEICKLQEQNSNHLKVLNETRLELGDKQEAVQLLQFDLQRSEKRVLSLLEVLKDKEETFKEMIGQLELKHEQELEKSIAALRISERKVIECEGQLDKKQGELIKLELELENKLDSLRNDRDQRINRLMMDQQKVERELQETEIKFVRQVEEAEQKSEIIKQLRSEVGRFGDESKRLSIELSKCEAKLSSKQQELNQALQDKAELERRHQDQAIRENQDYELNEIRRHCERLETTVEELKVDNEKLSTKLRLSESSISKVNSTINKEHAKMVYDYERKLEQIRVERSNYVRSELRYRKYGYKLKKYCEHLRRVHEHLCNPTACGYTITGPTRSVDQSMWLRSDGIYQLDEYKKSDSFSSDEETDLRGQQQSSIQTENNLPKKENSHFSTPSSGNKKLQRRHDKFTIKRTGTGSRSKPIDTCR